MILPASVDLYGIVTAALVAPLLYMRVSERARAHTLSLAIRTENEHPVSFHTNTAICGGSIRAHVTDSSKG